MTSNQRRQIACLCHFSPSIGRRVEAEVAALDDLDEIQQVVSRGLYAYAGYWGWLADVTITAAEWEQRDIQTYDPRLMKRGGAWESK